MVNGKQVKIFSGIANPALVQSICSYLEVREGKIMHSQFADGELYCRIDESVRGCDTFIIQPTCPPVTDNLMRLLITIDALRRASAGSVTAVVPYFGYSRQEKKSTGREPITAKLVANLICTAGAGRILSVDMHDPALQGFFDIPVDHLSAAPLLAEYFRATNLSNTVVVSPDTGGVHRARSFANRLGLPLAIIDKRRPEANKAVVMNVIGEVKGRDVVIIDDIVDTAGTLVRVAEALVEKGAKKITACCTHALLSDPATERIMKSSITEIVTTDSIPLGEEKRKACRVHTISLSKLIGEAIQRIYDKRSVSELFI
ncbi:MAG TPA: ribose-phosphate pyrophosphokinase [Candidatus Ozemobacteraceae bacterium]|nr:ribose-phosphate pyrophosphokinase [Candidatus Ozemobacteraceae bacterium]